MHDDNLFVIGDIHGNAAALGSLPWRLAVRDFWDTDKIIFLGDFIDRGPNPFNCCDIVKSYQQDCGDVVLRGNHEQLMLDALDDEWKWNAWVHYQNGDTTVKSFAEAYGRQTFSRTEFKELLEEFGWLKWLNSLPLWYEHETRDGKKILFCHAGIHPEGTKDTNFCRPGCYKPGEDDLSVLWIRDHFFHNKNAEQLLDKLGYEKVFVDHTPTFSSRLDFNEKLDKSLEVSPKLAANGRIVLCDTGSGYKNGRLTVLQIDDTLEPSVFWQSEQ